MITFILAALNYIMKCECTDSSGAAVYFSSVYLIIVILGGFSFICPPGLICNTYFARQFDGGLRIDINKAFVPSGMSLSESKLFVEMFVKKMLSLKDYTRNDINFKSHLINTGIGSEIKRTLKNEGITFTCKPYTIGVVETAVLNLLYGGKTRYRLRSHKKHPNGFKVHRTGHEFIIHLHP